MIFLDGGEREVPPKMKVLESKLGNKRIYNVSRFHLVASDALDKYFLLVAHVDRWIPGPSPLAIGAPVSR